MGVQVTSIDRLLTIHKSAVISIFLSLFLFFVHGYQTARSWDWEWVRMVKWNGPLWSDWSNREKWSTSKGGLIFSKLFRLDRTDPFSFRPKFPEILVEWIAPTDCTFYRAQHSLHVNFFRAWHWLHIFPRLTLVTCFIELSTRNLVCAWHWLHVFPRLTLVTRSPALGTGYGFSRAWH